jgi:hypothetical protein
VTLEYRVNVLEVVQVFSSLASVYARQQHQSGTVFERLRRNINRLRLQRYDTNLRYPITTRSSLETAEQYAKISIKHCYRVNEYGMLEALITTKTSSFAISVLPKKGRKRPNAVGVETPKRSLPLS